MRESDRLELDITAHLSTKGDQASPSDALLSRKFEKSKATGGWAAARVALQQVGQLYVT